MYRDLYGLEISESILETLRKHNLSTISECEKRAPIYLHSFDYGSIKYWANHTELPVNYLLMKGTPFDLDEVNQYATGIGFQDKLLWDYFSNTPTDTLKKTRDLGMIVHVWTFKDDELLFSASNNIEMYKIGHNVLKLDGVIT